MKITPLGDRILLEPIEEEVKSAAGIVIPDNVAKDAPQKAKVRAVGPGRWQNDAEVGKFRTPPDVKIGDTVLFAPFGPVSVKVNGKDFLIAKEPDVLAVVGEEKK